MKKLLVTLLALFLVCLTAASCDALPDEVKDILGIVVEIPENSDDNENEGNDGGFIHVHKYEMNVTEPTCYEQGYTTYTCECGKEYTDAVVDALGHDDVKYSAQSPTCTESGWEAYTECSRCGLSTYKDTPATGHYTVESLFFEIFENDDGTLFVEADCVLCDTFTHVTFDPYGLAVTPENKAELGISEYRPTIPTVYHVGDEWYVITAIGQNAFKNCTSYTEINLPKTLNTIAESAFEGCTGLTTLDLPDGVTYIYADAFKGCTSLTTVDIPESLESIGSGAFMNCSLLKTVTLNEGLRAIESEAFKGCSKLTKINIPDTVTVIGVSAFEGARLSTVIGGKGLRVITTDAFKDCSKLTTFFYTGTKEEFEAITIAPGNEQLNHIPIYYYSETKQSGCWHYDANGSPIPL